MYNLYFDDTNHPAFPWIVEILIPGISGRMAYKTKEEAEASLVPYLKTFFRPYYGILSEDDLVCLTSFASNNVRYLLKTLKKCEEGLYA